jgi:outer membrane lipoprotein LolB
VKQTSFRKNIITLCFISVLFSGCASVAPPAENTPVSWQARQASLASLQSWQLSGKLGVVSETDSGSMSVQWQQSQNHYTIRLMPPLNAGAMTLTGNDHGITLTTSDGKTTHANSPSELLRDNGGPALPVQNLRYWIRGLPAPGAATPHFDAYGRLSSLNQAGWQIDFLSYTHALARDLPSRISLNSPQLKIKMVIYQWE